MLFLDVELGKPDIQYRFFTFLECQENLSAFTLHSSGRQEVRWGLKITWNWSSKKYFYCSRVYKTYLELFWFGGFFFKLFSKWLHFSNPLHLWIFFFPQHLVTNNSFKCKQGDVHRTPVWYYLSVFFLRDQKREMSLASDFVCQPILADRAALHTSLAQGGQGKAQCFE